jgi:lon-related putative ATP-dependent protease
LAKELPLKSLRKTCDPNFIGCKTTQELAPLQQIIGQERAVKALKFGLGIRDQGFNIYVAGYPGTGRKTAVNNFVEKVASDEPVPPDWCYVNNFSNQYEPNAIKLPAGKGKEFQRKVKNLIESIRTALPKAFESDDYAARREATIRVLEKQRKELIDKLNAKAQQEGFIIQSTPIGLLLIPAVNGKPFKDEELLSLPQKTKDLIQEKRERLESELRNTMRQFLDMERKIREELKKLSRDVALFAIGNLVEDLIEKYRDMEEIKAYLKDVQNDILDNIAQFVTRGEPQEQTPFSVPWMKEAKFRKYEVNVIVDNSDAKGAPVVMEFNPTYQNLFGTTEKEAQFGALVTDFTMIRGGSLHKANNGYLIIPVEELLRNPFSYEGLKRALRDERIVIEEPQERFGFVSTKGLKPQPIALSIKVVLIGNPYLYQQLLTLDLEFTELFKVKAEFDTTMNSTEENVKQYAAFVCTICEKEKLKHLDGSGLAKLVEYSQRLAQDQQKLSTRFAEVADIIREANFYARQEKSDVVTGSHVKKAIEEKIYRSKLIQEKIQEMIQREILLIDTEAEKVGQANGLSIMGLGDFAFGNPSRVTASIGLGRKGIIDIEREAKMSGPIHTKGVLILSGYLNEKYAQDKPLSLSARLVFEQNYGGVEGDSASSTELYALLSALSGLPIKQSLAVTGSVNQKGEVQAIGGVNEKIEGFFEVCKAKGFNGHQGVMIPESNIQNLMLKEEVVEAVKAGRFHIYSAKTIDEGIEVLTGFEAGQRQKDGTFERGTLNYRVDKQLKGMAEKLKEFASVTAGEKKMENYL